MKCKKADEHCLLLKKERPWSGRSFRRVGLLSQASGIRETELRWAGRRVLKETRYGRGDTTATFIVPLTSQELPWCFLLSLLRRSKLPSGLSERAGIGGHFPGVGWCDPEYRG